MKQFLSALILPIALLAVPRVASAEHFGPYQIKATPTNATQIAGTWIPTAALNVVNAPLNLQEVFASSAPLGDRGYANASPGTTIRATFGAGDLANGVGADLIFVDAPYSANSYAIYIDYDNYTTPLTLTPAAAVRTGEFKDYFCYGAEFHGVELVAFPIDLSFWGVPMGTAVQSVQFVTTSSEADPVGFGSLTSAQTFPLIAPNAYYWAGSDGWVSGGAGGRLQQMHHKSQFWPQNETHAITGLAWRPGKGNMIENVNWTITNIEVWVSTVTVDVGDLSPTFANNYAAATNRTRVYAGPITFAYNITDSTVTQPFGQVIPFQVPFNYTPAEGHLLVDFINFDDAHNSWHRQVDIVARTDTTTSCIWGVHNANQPTGNANVWGIGLVTQFQTDYPWVPPQPTQVSLLSISLNPTTLKGGEVGSGTVRLDAPAPVGGVDVALVSDNTSVVNVNSPIHIGTGQVEGPFSVYTRLATNTTSATITATLNGTNSLSATLTINRTFPPVGEPEDIWQTEIVPNTPNQLYGAWSSIALFNNEPWISYQDSTGVGTVKLAHKTGGQWIVETVDGDPALPDQALFAAGPTSLKLDHLGQPNVAYYSSEGLRWAKKTGSTWTYNKVDASTEPIGISLVLDADDHPHIAFFDAGGGAAYGLYYVHWNGSAWDQNHFQVSGNVWNDGYKGTGSALALDANGVPSIAFSDPATGQLRIAKLNGSPDFSDALWTNSVVTGALYSAYPSLAIDAANRPHVAYQRAEPGTNTMLQHARFTGTDWLVTTADAGGPAHYDVGANTCLVLDPQQRPRVSYWDTTMNTIRYAHFDGVTWLTHLVDPTNHVGLFSTSLALDFWGAPHLSYYEQHTLPGGIVRGSLRYATLAPPRMRLATMPGGLLELVWPGEPQGFTLQSSTNLADPLWLPWNTTLSENAGVKRATFGGGDPRRFFLLKR